VFKYLHSLSSLYLQLATQQVLCSFSQKMSSVFCYSICPNNKCSNVVNSTGDFEHFSDSWNTKRTKLTCYFFPSPLFPTLFHECKCLQLAHIDTHTMRPLIRPIGVVVRMSEVIDCHLSLLVSGGACHQMVTSH